MPLRPCAYFNLSVAAATFWELRVETARSDVVFIHAAQESEKVKFEASISFCYRRGQMGRTHGRTHLYFHILKGELHFSKPLVSNRFQSNKTRVLKLFRVHLWPI